MSTNKENAQAIFDILLLGLCTALLLLSMIFFQAIDGMDKRITQLEAKIEAKK